MQIAIARLVAPGFLRMHIGFYYLYYSNNIETMAHAFISRRIDCCSNSTQQATACAEHVSVLRLICNESKYCHITPLLVAYIGCL